MTVHTVDNSSHKGLPQGELVPSVLFMAEVFWRMKVQVGEVYLKRDI